MWVDGAGNDGMDQQVMNGDRLLVLDCDRGGGRPECLLLLEETCGIGLGYVGCCGSGNQAVQSEDGYDSEPALMHWIQRNSLPERKAECAFYWCIRDTRISQVTSIEIDSTSPTDEEILGVVCDIDLRTDFRYFCWRPSLRICCMLTSMLPNVHIEGTTT